MPSFTSLLAKFKRFHSFVQSLLVQVVLHGFFVIGIGVTALVARLLGYRFLVHHNQDSTWQPITGSNQIQKQF